MEDENMIKVLCIGQYDAEGKFIREQWRCFIEWCKTECNKIIIYSQMYYNTVCSKFYSYCNIIELEKPDESLDINAYEINVVDERFWDYINYYNYNIDVDNSISHMFFFDSEQYVASIEIVDYENYVFIEDPIAHEEKLLLNQLLIQDNIQLCLKGEADIDELLQDEIWEPLGKL